MKERDFEAALASIVGARHCILDEDVRLGYETDWHGRRLGAARAVVRPGSTAEVVSVVQLCASEGVPIVPQGGNTGLVLGGVPRGGEVVLSLRRLASRPHLDAEAGILTVDAGVTLATAQETARSAGFEIGLDMASAATATVGGVAATNAGGRKVLRYGSARRRIVGLEAVLGDGRVIARQQLLKENAGYDLVSLLVGSEGTLGIITRVMFLLAEASERSVVALLALRDLEQAVAVLETCLRELGTVESAEFFLDEGLDLVCAHLGIRPPFRDRYPAYLTLELAGDESDQKHLFDLVAADPQVMDAVVGMTPPERRRLWTYREAHTASINAVGIPIRFDVSVPIGKLPGFCDSVRSEIERVAPGSRPVLFGHLGEGNVHINVLDVGGREEAITEVVAEAIRMVGGTMSAEHGVGRLKCAWLEEYRGADDVSAMRSLKAALDPSGILNPGVMFAEMWPSSSEQRGGRPPGIEHP